MGDKGMPGANGVENLLIDLGEYTSPIKVLHTQIQTSIENDILKVIEKHGIEVDKDELIKALAYDRDQYNKGYKDGVAACEHRLGRLFPKKVTHESTLYRDCTCPNCGNVVSKYETWGDDIVRITSQYCIYCGQALDWSDDNG